MQPKVVIIDDEHHARRKIRQFLDDDFDVNVVGEFSDRDSAIEGIRSLQPDLVFLDVQLRAASGLDIVEAIGVDAMPPTVFVTAYDEYAVRAFDLHAVDYLLKPYDRQRFRAAMQRAVDRLSRADLKEQLRALLEGLHATVHGPSRTRRWLLVKRNNQTSVLVPTDAIEWIEAAGNYVYIHVGGTRHLHRQPLGELGEQLDSTRFVRVHRSAIVNLEFVRDISPWGGGDFHIRMKSGAELRLSRHYREAFDRLLQSGG